MHLLQLFQIEFYKQRHNRSVVFLFLGTIFLFVFLANMDFLKTVMNLDFPFIWNYTTYLASFLKYFLALIVIFMISGEYTYRTLKQNLIDGLSKRQWIISKVSMIFALAFFTTFVVFLLTLYLGFQNAVDTSWNLVFKGAFAYLFGYFLDMLFFFCMLMFFTLLCKKSIFSIGSVFAWFIAERFIAYYFSALEIFLPFSVMAGLTKQPTNITVSPDAKIDQLLFPDSVLYIALVWIIFFICGGYFILKKRDL